MPTLPLFPPLISHPQKDAGRTDALALLEAIREEAAHRVRPKATSVAVIIECEKGSGYQGSLMPIVGLV